MTLHADHSTDGRLSPEEFETVLINAGITWLNSGDMRRKFDSLDEDRSGRLNLGEVLSAATRVSDLLRRAKAYEVEVLNKEGRFLNQENLFEEFSHLLIAGEDLVGSRQHHRIGDDAITASSYWGGLADFGAKGAMWRSRLDSEETSWVGDVSSQDPSPWVQWRFDSPRVIKTVVTRGRPDKEGWVSRYRLRYEDSNQQWCDYEHELQGNDDRGTTKENSLKPPILAVAVKLCPTDYKGGSPALRATLLGAFPDILPHDPEWDPELTLHPEKQQKTARKIVRRLEYLRGTMTRASVVKAGGKRP